MSVRRMSWLVCTAIILILIVIGWLFSHHVIPFDCTATNKPAKLMSAKEIYQYLHWTNSTSCLLAVDFGFHVAKGVGIAAPDGHKAVCLDRLIAPIFSNCLVYSFGINNQWAFDDAMAQYGCQVYSFDPSMGVGDYDRSQHIHFYNVGLAGEDGMHPVKKWNMKTASSIYQMLGYYHGDTTIIDVLKMDVEFSEWEVIPQMLRSGFLADKVKQLAVEIHFNADDPIETFRRYAGILQDLESFRVSSSSGAGKFVRFSSRPNPGLKRGVSILRGEDAYIGLELAWYNSRFYYSVSNQSQTRFFPYYK
ncbi:hypothetical protein GHT06_016024 [Daphnia sinensis]|uniref:Methyltransferase domain-containing protein n=1 Tax=Daphnia sinensis TaxID=1820382 RepID=A0AAD5LC86_9CRUS|nr:hypothetical protein GHT06_016024 [Daphnia sinensis]